MSKAVIGLIIAGAYIAIAFLVILIYIFVKPEDDLYDICGVGLGWPFALVILTIFIPFKLLEILQNKLREQRSERKYYDEDEYRSENEDWYSEE